MNIDVVVTCGAGQNLLNYHLQPEQKEQTSVRSVKSFFNNKTIHLWISEMKYAWSNEQKWTVKWQCSLRCWFPLATTGTRPSVCPAAGYTAVSIPYFLPGSPPEGLAFKRRAHVLSYVGQFQGGILKRAIALLWEKETAETEIVHGVTRLSRSQSIQPVL